MATHAEDGIVRQSEQRLGPFSTLCADVTGPWFEARGRDIAARSRTKQSMPNRHKVGILLLCEEHGFTLHWCTFPSRTRDTGALRDLVGTIEDRKWVLNVPLVLDLAMGSAGALARRWSSTLRFLTP